MKNFVNSINQATFILVFFIIFYSVVAFLPKTPGMTLTNGDEPHYLIITSSLIKDGDLYLINNYEQGDYRDWYPEGKLEMHLITVNGKLYPLHQVGLSLLILPGFLLAERLGAILTVSILAAVSLFFLYKILLNFVHKNLAFVVSMLVGATAPLGVYSILLYPEAAIVAFVTIGLYVVLHKKFSLNLKNGAILLLTIGLIPIFHIKFVTLLTMFLVFINFKLFKKVPLSRLIIFSLFMVAPTLIYLVWLNGQFDGDLFAGLRGYKTSNVFSLLNIPSGLLAYLVDRENGILLFAPYYIYAIYGTRQIVSRFLTNIRQYRKMENLLFVFFFTCSFIAFFTMYPDLIGGANPSGRYLLPVLPALVILLAIGLKDRLQFPDQKRILRLLAVYSLIIFTIFATNQIMTIPSGHESNLVNHIFKGKATLVHKLLPNLSKFNDRAIPASDFLKGTFILAVLVVMSSLNKIPAQRSKKN